jgi:hypothetical protein
MGSVGIRFEDPAQMHLAQDNDVVQTLAPDRSDQPFVVPTIGSDLLYAFVIVRLDRREMVWINVTTNPTAE